MLLGAHTNPYETGGEKLHLSGGGKIKLSVEFWNPESNLEV
jgi:hypothetical protein